MGSERIRQIGQGRLEGVRSGERTRPRGLATAPSRSRTFLYLFNIQIASSDFCFCSLLLAPDLRAPCPSSVLASRCPWSCRPVFRFLPATLVVFQQRYFIHHIVSAHLDVVDADSLVRA